MQPWCPKAVSCGMQCSIFCGAGSSKKKGHRALFFFSSYPVQRFSIPVRPLSLAMQPTAFFASSFLLSNTFGAYTRLVYINQNATILVRVYTKHNSYCYSPFSSIELFLESPPLPTRKSHYNKSDTSHTWMDGWMGWRDGVVRGNGACLLARLHFFC
jgi:hypothetical protein